MRERTRTWLLVVPAVLVGIGLGTAAVAFTGGDDGADEPVDELTDPQGLPAEHRANATAFLEAWHQFRTGTFVVVLRFERTKPGEEAPLVSDGILAQQPPRRIVRAFGNESAVFADGAQTCELGANNSAVCGAAQRTAPYDVQVAEELSILSQYFSGDAPLYRVEASSKGCFQLYLYRPVPLPPYGDVAQFCFDAATRAMTLFEMKTAGGNERTTAVSISTTVTDADFTR